MKVTIKTLGNQTFELDGEDSKTVGDLKKKLVEKHQYQENGLKFVFKGKVLGDDSALLSAVEIAENDVIVIMGKKAAVAPTPTPAPAESEAQAPKPMDTDSAATSTSPEAEKPAEPATEATAEPMATDATDAPAAADDGMLTGGKLDEAVANIMAMGDWPKEKVQRALRAAYNNPDRAVQFLFEDNIPGDAGGPPPIPPAALAAAQAAAAQGGAGAGATGAGAGTGPGAADLAGGIAAALAGQQPAANRSPLAEALASVPQFEQLRQLILQQPQMLQAVIPQLQSINPQLFELIQQNPQEFEGFIRNGLPAGGAGAGAGAAGPMPGMGGPPPGAIQVTAAEKADIDRLREMFGFPEAMAAEAYLVCGKNFELAANYLLENGQDMLTDDGPDGN